MKVAVLGATGRLGRETIARLSKKGIATRCLVRPQSSGGSSSSSNKKQEIIAYLKTLPGVELVEGDVTDPKSLQTLLDSETTACLALYGPTAPKPFIRSLLLPALLFPESDPSHPKQINYEGIKRLLAAMEASPQCKRLVRITGKGENPWSLFSILINALGGVAKGWNYEGEQVIRQNRNIDYTIIRPGIMKDVVENEDSGSNRWVLGLRDNGGDLKVTAVSYGRIADLVIQAFQRDSCKRCTITAMNVNQEEEKECVQLSSLDQLQPDTREFPESLIAEHKKAARVGGLAILLVIALVAKAIFSGILSLLQLLLGSP